MIMEVSVDSKIIHLSIRLQSLDELVMPHKYNTNIFFFHESGTSLMELQNNQIHVIMSSKQC